MAFLFRLRIKICPVIFIVIIYLQGITADHYLCRANKGTQRTLIVFDDFAIAFRCIEFLRGIACHDKQNGDEMLIITHRVLFIAERLENQAFIQCSDASADIPQIIGCADDQTVRLTNFFQNRGKAILTNANALMFRQFTAKTGRYSL